MTAPSWNPFHVPDHDGTHGRTETTPAPAGRPRPVERDEMAWGSWATTAVLEGQYASALLTIRTGGVLRLQHHLRLHKTITVLSGRVRIEFGPTVQRLETVELGAGESLPVPAHTVHRVTALSDSEVLQTSTAPPGWRQDAVRDRDPQAGTPAARSSE